MFENPTVADFKDYFVRDFPYGVDLAENVVDADITKAIDQTLCQINEALFCSQKEYDIGFLNLAAHYLVTNIQASSQGISGRFEWATSSKSVGSVSIGSSIPDSILANPQYSWLSTTNYGINYLMLVYPRLYGNIFTVQGGTKA